MAKKTMTIKSIVESQTPIFDFNYPMIDGYREVFEEKFIDNFYYREMNFYTFEEFQHRLKSKLCNIMPYYIQLYKSEFLIENPLTNYDLKECFERENDNKLDVTKVGYNRSGETERTHSENVADFQSDSNRDNTENEQKDFTENENLTKNVEFESDKDITTTSLSTENKDEKTTNISDTTENHTKDIDTTFKTIGEENETNRKDVVSNSDKTTDKDETISTKKTSIFNDTPMNNLVISSDPLVVDYAYATTLTTDTTNTTDNTDIVENVNSEDNTFFTGSKTDVEDKEEHEKEYLTSSKVVDENGTNVQENTINIDTTSHEYFNSTEDTHQEVDKAGNDNRDLIGNVKENIVTHGENSAQDVRNNDNFSSDTTSSNRVIKDETKFQRIVSGIKTKTESELLLLFRKTFINIDIQIFDECETLFYGIY